ncbi:hypothetical protein BHUM_02026 [Candidatus Burkholderia humilis]|nr:hypothetical protein BHUM_02026 [Candidatus Burkholderia humilis]
MSHALPFKRSRTPLTKAQLLPIPRATANELALHAHLAIKALRAGSVDIAPAQLIAETMLLVRFLAETGHGEFSHEALIDANRVMAAVFDAGQASSMWRLPADDVDEFAAIVSLYDRQLQRASLAALTVAYERLDRFKAGEVYQPLQRRRA